MTKYNMQPKLPAVLFIIVLLPLTLFSQYSVGMTPPNFTLNDIHHNQYSLYDYMGEIIILNF